MRCWKILFIALALGPLSPASAADIAATVYRNPNCGCCSIYADYLRSNGFDVKLVNTTDMASIKQKYGVPANLEGCHTAVINGQVFEGLIPVEYVKKMLSKHPMMKGLSLPGMPSGVPGMPGAKRGPLHVYYLSSATPPRVFAEF